jgi:hypothetical protein
LAVISPEWQQMQATASDPFSKAWKNNGVFDITFAEQVNLCEIWLFVRGGALPIFKGGGV